MLYMYVCKTSAVHSNDFSNRQLLSQAENALLISLITTSLLFIVTLDLGSELSILMVLENQLRWDRDYLHLVLH